MDGAKRILAIETSGRQGSIAALCGETDQCRLVGQYAETGSELTAQSLAPSIERLLKEANWEPTSVDLVAVAVGPGSFTGLRIGVTTAKAFAYAAGAEVVGINTLAAIATQAPHSSTPLWVVSDAQRQELFAAQYAMDDGGSLRMERETCILSQDAWIAALRAGDRVTGPALVRMSVRLPAGVEAVTAALWQPTAAAVGALDGESTATVAAAMFGNLCRSTTASAAEEKRPV